MLSHCESGSEERFSFNSYIFLVHAVPSVLDKFIQHAIKLKKCVQCLMQDLFVWGFTSNSRIFHSCGDVTSTGELDILTYTWHVL